MQNYSFPGATPHFTTPTTLDDSLAFLSTPEQNIKEAQ